MGEIFPVERPAVDLQFTGERLTSAAYGQIEYEHVHRYCFARLFCRGKDVIDVASGEGYGSALLAQVAKRVIGIDCASDAVEHATATYRRRNLSFILGGADQLPLARHSVDIAVSFETIEHLYEHERFLAEIRRVLRPDGLLVISSPDSEVYSYPGSEVNPFHVRELSADEFKAALRAVFPQVQFYAQRALVGSVIAIDGANQGALTFERRSEGYIDARRGVPRAPYLVAVASARGLDEPCQTLYIDVTQSAHLLTSRFDEEPGQPIAAGPEPTLHEDETAALRAELSRCEVVHADLERKLALVEKECLAVRLAAAEAAHPELVRLGEALADAKAETHRLRETFEAAERKAQAELERQLAMVEKERLAAQLAAAEAAHPELVRLGEALASAKAETQQLRETFDAAERKALAEIEKRGALIEKLAQQRDAAQRSDQVAREDVDRLRNALATVDRDTRQRELTAESTAAKRVAARPRGAALYRGPVPASDGHRRSPGWMARAIRGVGRRRVGAAIRAGDRASRTGEMAAAARHYRRALNSAPHLAPIWVQLGHVLKEQGDHEGAEAAYRRSLKLDGSVADTHLQLGHLLKLTGRLMESAEAYACASELDRELPHVGAELEALWPRLVEEGDRARDAGRLGVRDAVLPVRSRTAARPRGGVGAARQRAQGTG
jgi:SAM-dependent methyltransferase/tetratricopeptide (TPR) repeat protein